jgi:galactokinase
MKSVAKYFGKEYLRQLSKADVLENIQSLRQTVGDRAILRAIHFFNENERVATQAEALKNSTDWKATAEIMSKLQKEWKEVGPVPKKHSDNIWKRFIGACDYFFEQKGKAEASHRSVEHENLDKKKAIIEKLEAINNGDAPAESFSNTVRELMKEWNNIGHVPYKDKDRIYKQYRALVDSLFNKMNQSASKKKLSNFKSNLKKEGNIYRERERLMRIHDNMKNEIKTYENNIGFLTSSSKKGNSLVNEMNRKIEKLKADLDLITQKIAVIDESLKE